VSHPSDLSYTDMHEWVRFDGSVVTVGITSYAAEALGDIIFVALPAAGSRLQANEPCGELESTKSVSELYAPVSGIVVEINASVVDDPSQINSDPFGAAWLFRVSTETEIQPLLLNAAEYSELLKGA